jgi:peptide/nickel transport system permease protein
LGKRLVGSLFVLLGVALIVFFISHLLNPNPAALWAGPRARPETIKAVAAVYHLNDPVLTQLYYYFQGLVTGNFGVDPQTGRQIMSEILFYAPNTLELVLASMAIIITLGIALGYTSGMRFGTKVDSAIRLFYLTTWSTPYYLGAMVAVLVFASYIPIFPSGGNGTVGFTYTPITGIFVLDSLLQANWGALESGLYHLVLPATTLALLSFGIVPRIMRSSILDTRWSTHVKAARARGLDEGDVRRKHILRNALIDTTTVIATTFGWLFSGTIIVEQIFAWPGIGQFSYTAIVSANYPVLVACVFVFTLGVIIANFIADIIYPLLDPRITLGEGG